MTHDWTAPHLTQKDLVLVSLLASVPNPCNDPEFAVQNCPCLCLWKTNIKAQFYRNSLPGAHLFFTNVEVINLLPIQLNSFESYVENTRKTINSSAIQKYSQNLVSLILALSVHSHTQFGRSSKKWSFIKSIFPCKCYTDLKVVKKKDLYLWN